MKKMMLVMLVASLGLGGMWFLTHPSETARQQVEKNTESVQVAVEDYLAGKPVEASRFPWYRDGHIDAQTLDSWCLAGMITETQRNAFIPGTVVLLQKRPQQAAK